MKAEDRPPGYFEAKHRDAIFGCSFNNSAMLMRHVRRGAARNAALYLIDGEYADAKMIASRLNLPKDKAMHAVRKAKQKPGPLTWAKLGVTP